jgi:hypothetical protein
VRLARSFDDLTAAIDEYLADRSRLHEGRRRIAAEQCGVLDGQAGIRMAEAVLSCATGERGL